MVPDVLPTVPPSQSVPSPVPPSVIGLVSPAEMLTVPGTTPAPPFAKVKVVTGENVMTASDGRGLINTQLIATVLAPTAVTRALGGMHICPVELYTGCTGWPTTTPLAAGEIIGRMAFWPETASVEESGSVGEFPNPAGPVSGGTDVWLKPGQIVDMISGVAELFADHRKSPPPLSPGVE